MTKKPLKPLVENLKIAMAIVVIKVVSAHQFVIISLLP